MKRLVFIHGLGDDASVWDIVLDQPCMDLFDCEAIQVPGFGGRPFEGRSLEDAASQIWNEVDNRTPTVLVGHSMGGVIATLIAESTPINLLGIVNVEGNLTAHDAYFSGKAASAPDFDRWFEMFRDNWPGRYGDALDRCEPMALRSCAGDLVRLSKGDEIGQRYRHLSVPHLYVMGTTAMAPESVAFLNDEETATLEAGHWVMQDQPIGFSAHVACWAEEKRA